MIQPSTVLKFGPICFSLHYKVNLQTKTMIWTCYLNRSFLLACFVNQFDVVCYCSNISVTNKQPSCYHFQKYPVKLVCLIDQFDIVYYCSNILVPNRQPCYHFQQHPFKTDSNMPNELLLLLLLTTTTSHPWCLA